MSRRRHAARGVPGGYRIRDTKARRWWGDLYEACPDDLLTDASDPARITSPLRRHDLTDAQWAVLAPLLPARSPTGRPPKWEERQLIDRIR